MVFAAARRKAGLSQAGAAKKLGVDQTAISNWECGKNMPTAWMLKRVADLYGCTVDELLDDQEEL